MAPSLLSLTLEEQNGDDLPDKLKVAKTIRSRVKPSFTATLEVRVCRSVRKNILLSSILLPLAFYLLVASPILSAQGLERCDAQHIREEGNKIIKSTADAQAATSGLLSSLSGKAHWTDELLESGIVLTGTLTYPSGQRHPVTIYYKGERKFRLEESIGSGNRILVANGGAAAVQTGSHTRPAAVDVLQEENSFLPFFPTLDSLQNHSLLTEAKADPSHQGDIRLRAFRLPTASNLSSGGNSAETTAGKDFPTRLNGRITEAEFWLDPQSLLPTEIRGCLTLIANPGGSQQIIRHFGSYAVQDGVQYPSHIDEFIGGHLRSSLEVTSIKFSQSIDEKLWLIPTVEPQEAH